MHKFLILEFTNAGLIRNHRNTKDRFLNVHQRHETRTNDQFVEPITVHQISNMLHVLFGERPKPYHRDTFYGAIDSIFEKAQQSYIRIDTHKDKDVYHKENMHIKKSVWNAWSPVVSENWERVRRYLGYEVFTTFVDVLNEVFEENVTDSAFCEIATKYKETQDTRLDNLNEYLRVNFKSALIGHIYKGTSDMNKYSGLERNVLHGVESVVRLNGQIAVPVSEDDIVKLKQNKGCATLLDGGMVYIKGLESSNTWNDEGFIEVGSISLQLKSKDENQDKLLSKQDASSNSEPVAS